VEHSKNKRRWNKMTYTPEVSIQTRIQTKLLADINTGTAFIVASNNWGAENVMQEYEGSADITQDYKAGPLVDAANLFVQGGGRDVKVYRYVPNDAVAAAKTLQGSSADKITLTAKYKGTYGNNIWFKAEEVTAGYVKLTVSDGYATEIFDNDTTGYNTISGIYVAVSGNSDLVTPTLVSATGMIDEYTKTFLSSGTSGVNGSAIALTNVSSVVNSKIDEPYDFLLVPEITVDASQGTIANLMSARDVNNKELSIFLTGVTTDEAYATTIARTASTTDGRMVIVTPGTTLIDGVKYSGGYTACYYAGLLAKKPIGQSLTHNSFALDTYVSYTSETTFTKNYTPAQVEALLAAGFTPINKIGNYNGVIRAVTKITDVTSPLFEQVVLKEIDYVKNNLQNILNPFVGQPNTDKKRSEIKITADAFLDKAVLDGILTEYSTEVVLDGVDKVRINMSVTPVYAINGITVNLTI
jgi:hypothetical protein